MEWVRGRILESLLADFDFVGGYPGRRLQQRRLPGSPADRRAGRHD
jgi:hypothetical protein